ncbi:hypothetical protein TWF718_002180 [Orbilia javanica]|uniref:RING-type domain-containing protein n=1 Tax=Orbilia javanica TaxID=47235 RepID=A0AAN8MGT6_9PEZI
MYSRTRRVSALGKDPATSAEAGQTIHSYALALGWASKSNRKSLQRPFVGEKKAKCTICGDTFLGYELERLICGHRHCRDCLRQNFQYVINDPTAYPPKCCRVLPLSQTAFVLSDEEIKEVLELQRKHESSRVIPCFSCEGDIYLSDIGREAAYCIKCDKLTCTTCRKEMHDGLCPEDPETGKLIAAAAEEGWTQCPKCSRLIAKVSGCNSMVCLCKAHLCFRCGKLFAGCVCSTIPRDSSESFHKSRATIEFSAAFTNGSLSRKATPRERQNYRVLRDYRVVALSNNENQKFKLKDLKLKRQLKVKDDEMAKDIIRLRAKMEDLTASEKVERRERMKAIRKIGGVGVDGTTNIAERVIVTRRCVYTSNGVVQKKDDRPVSRSTRSHDHS